MSISDSEPCNRRRPRLPDDCRPGHRRRPVACIVFRALELHSTFHIFFAGFVSGIFLAAAYFATTESAPRDNP
ncbi:hypothetical protein KJ781_00300 [Patescibacteria group bacterium]|nr:hypothetical protein [Patescibacteria group bacterium]MBU1448715.1 hypothetical protein [Patescibacteria group bacterium]MBU2613060.1 hypothetical protein [Patescibacteria group bacterium]